MGQILSLYRNLTATRHGMDDTFIHDEPPKLPTLDDRTDAEDEAIHEVEI